MEARHILVSGIVQGVGFRWFTERVANELGVRGWVRNLHDGRVEIHAEGTADQLDALVDRVRVGPRSSDVTDVHVAATGLKGTTGFTVERTAAAPESD